MEEWRDIPGYEGRYQASTEGRIKSLERYVNHICGKRLVRARILKPATLNKTGHLHVVMGLGGARMPVHQLVMRTFVGEAPPNMEVLHTNGDPADNRLCNLRYGTRADNLLDVYRIGGKLNKLTLMQIREIHERANSGEVGTHLAAEYGVSKTQIYRIRKGEYSTCTLFIT